MPKLLETKPGSLEEAIIHVVQGKNKQLDEATSSVNTSVEMIVNDPKKYDKMRKAINAEVWKMKDGWTRYANGIFTIGVILSHIDRKKIAIPGDKQATKLKKTLDTLKKMTDEMDKGISDKAFDEYEKISAFTLKNIPRK